MGTTENIIVLFTDLVGSTEAAASLSPERADDLRDRHFSTLRQAVAASGGLEIKNLGDGLMVVFPAASAALTCAVAMQQAVERGGVQDEPPQRLRVGLSAGEATKEGEDYFGEPVVEASRLCAHADPNQILVTDLVRANAGRRSSHTFTPLGALKLKGLPEPVQVLEVGWQPLELESQTGPVPLPSRLSHRPGVGLIGREQELATLDSALKRVVSGEGREVVLIAGEPGLGKTVLVSEFARRAHESEAVVVLGRCDEEVGAPYLPFSQALTHYVSHADERQLLAHVEAHGGELVRLVPALHQRLRELPPPQSADADTERYLLLAAVVGIIQSASEDRPLILVLDDLHWADRPSLQLLRHVVANTSTARVLVLGTYRDAELSNSHPLTDLLAALHREPSGLSIIDLKGFDDSAVITFMESAAGHALDDAGIGLAHELYRETDGNPFFVAEILRFLSESGAIQQDSSTGRWSTAEPGGSVALPHSVRAVVGSRVTRLGDEATRVLSTAAVIGRDFDLSLLAETTRVDEDDLIDMLERARHAAIVYELADSPGQYGFSHALIQHTLYEDIPAARRSRLHRSVGEAIERLCGESTDVRVVELARHFLLATSPTKPEKAISYSSRAGLAALAALAPEEAVRYFEQALELASHVPTLHPSARIDLLISMGIAQRHAGIAAFRTTLLAAANAARREGDASRLAAAALANSRGWFTSLGQIDREKVDVIEAALDALPESDSPERARLLAMLANELTYHRPLKDRLALANEGMTMARRIGDPATFVDTIGACATGIRSFSTISMQLEQLAEAWADCETLDDPDRLHVICSNFYPVLICDAQFDVAAQRLRILEALSHRLRQPARLWNATFFAASEALLQGDATRAEQLAAAALEFGTVSGQPDASAFYGSQLMAVRRIQGRYGELVPIIAEVAEQNPAVSSFRAVLAAAQVEAGDEVAARALYDEAAANAFSFNEDSGWGTTLALFARVTLDLQVQDGAETLFDLLAPYHGFVPHNGLSPSEPVSMYLGGLATLLRRYDVAGPFFEEAATLNARGGMRYCAAHTSYQWGRMLRLRDDVGDLDRSRDLLAQARSIARSGGYSRIERQASAELSMLPE